MQLDTLGVLKCVFFFFFLLLKPVSDQSMKALLNVNKVFPAAHPERQPDRDDHMLSEDVFSSANFLVI